MRKLISALLILVLSTLPCFAFGNKHRFDELQAKQHRAMHEIVMVDRDEDGSIVHGGLCTAYAVGPHTLLTAEHCNDPKTNAVYVDAPVDLIKHNQIMSHTVTNRVFDNQDHMLIDVSGIYFKDTIELTDHVRVPKQGEHVYQWGNPAGIRDQYREGLVVGTVPYARTDGDVDSDGPIFYLVQEAVIGGDSGSAVFSAVDGQLIGIITFGIDDGQMAGVFPIQFTQAQIDEARK